MFADEITEYRCLGAIIDTPKEALDTSVELVTGIRVPILNAMKEAFMHYGFLSTEAVEEFYGSMLPPEVEMGRGAKIKPIKEKLAKLATKRQVAKLSEQLALMVNQPDIDRDTILQALKLNPINNNENSSLAPGIEHFVSDYQRKKSGQYKFIDTGMPFLNHMMGGEWQRQALTIVMGQAGGGKTALICNSILAMARIGIPSLFCSLEMPKHKLISRFIANMASVDGLKLRQGSIDNDEEKRINKALEELQSLPIYIIDVPTLNVHDIVYQVKAHKEAFGIEAFFVDYLQIVNHESDGDDNTAYTLGYIAQQLRNVAVQEEIASVVLSQQNRQYKGLQSILGSGRVGHIADTTFEITLAEGTTESFTEIRNCTMDFHKNREGPCGQSYTAYNAKFLRFE